MVDLAKLAQDIRSWQPAPNAQLNRSAADARWAQVALIEMYITHASTDEVLSLIRSDAIPAQHELYGSVLGLAVKYGTAELVEALINAGCSVNAGDGSGMTPTEHAIKSFRARKDPRMLDALLKAGGKRLGGENLLCYAAYHGSVPSVEVLLRRGHDPDEKCRVTWTTPLICALTEPDSHSIAVTHLLLEAGANPNKSGSHPHLRTDTDIPINKLAITDAAGIADSTIEELFDAMMKAGLIIDHAHRDLYHPLTLCLRANNDAYARLLLRHGANPIHVNTFYRDGAAVVDGDADSRGNTHNHMRKSPFQLFVGSEMPLTVAYMIEHMDEDPEQRLFDGTPLVQLAFHPPTRAVMNAAISQKRISLALEGGASHEPQPTRSRAAPSL